MLNLPRDLGDGLTLRWATPADAEAIAEFNALIHSDTAQPDEGIRLWTLELMNGQHPTTKASDFTVVIDEPAGGKVVSSLNLISQTWEYEGVPFGVGQPEIVGTLPEYRRKNLVRQQFDIIHALSEGRDHLVQAISGIPWYYRQFGYEMALNLGGGRRLLWENVRVLPAEQPEVYRKRPATFADIPLLRELYAVHCSTSMVNRVRDEAHWHYELSPHDEKSLTHHRFEIIEDLAGVSVGYCEAHPGRVNTILLYELAVLPGHSLRAVCEFLARAFKAEAEEINKQRQANGGSLITMLWLNFGAEHPVYTAFGNQLEKPNPPYAWYIRVPDLPAFIRQIAPALEKRLAASVMAGHSGTLRLNFYRRHVTLVFERGKLVEVGTYTPNRVQDGDAAFPDLTFLHLLFGHRSLDDLRYAYPDCFVGAEPVSVLLNALFPKKPSEVVHLY